MVADIEAEEVTAQAMPAVVAMDVGVQMVRVQGAVVKGGVVLVEAGLVVAAWVAVVMVEEA